MAVIINNIKLTVDHSQADLILAIEKKLKTPFNKVKDYKIHKRSIDARKKNNVMFIYQIELDLTIDETILVNKLHDQDVHIARSRKEPEAILHGSKMLQQQPIVIGAGPAGIFAALKLAEHGYQPLVLERGSDVEKRKQDILDFWKSGKLNVNSNVQFGEGGAGTFSDGKLTTRTHDPRIDQVFQTLVNEGAPKEIIYEHKPHIGTDKLQQVVVNLRKKLLKMGGTIKFNSLVTKIIIEQNKITAIEVNNQVQIPAQVVILAIGHSARDTYEMLYRQGVVLEPKSLAIGVRIEHPQSLINKAQYGAFAESPQIGAADYTLIKKTGNHPDERAVYSFCMCPGGVVVAAASEKEAVVTNGMSYYNRASGVANSALVATISTDDFKGEDPLAGVRYLRKYEKKAYQLGGGGYKAPAQKVGDFLAGKESNELLAAFSPTYQPGVTPTDLHQALPHFVSKSLETAIIDFGKKLKGYDNKDAILTGIETRTSAPVRIPREGNFQATNLEGLFPAGEGAGYAGGIVSAAVDGLRVAEGLITSYQLPRNKINEEQMRWEDISEQTE